MRKNSKNKDDSLYGLLTVFKAYCTYLKILVSEADKKVVVQLSDNPKNLLRIPNEDYVAYKALRRLEVGTIKLSIKYIKPQHLLKIYGPLLGIKLPVEKVAISNKLDGEGYFIIEAPFRNLNKVLQGVRKLINLSSQKKYEILEKCLIENQDEL